MIVNLILRYSQSEWDSEDIGAYDPIYVGVRMYGWEAHAFARECRMKDSLNVYIVRKVKIT